MRWNRIRYERRVRFDVGVLDNGIIYNSDGSTRTTSGRL
jgi:hypothetical protein